MAATQVASNTYQLSSSNEQMFLVLLHWWMLLLMLHASDALKLLQLQQLVLQVQQCHQLSADAAAP
jgi:hypothetical protein